MIVTRTPLRVSFAGDGTDLPGFYSTADGAVFSTAIDKYVYVTVKRHSDLFLEPVRINYSRTEEANTIGEIQNNIARECLRFLEIDPPIYVSTVADAPASTGLGASSSFAVGLLNALHSFRGERVSAAQLAEEATHIELDVLRQPLGKQDQYAAAFGGLNLFCFHGAGVVVHPRHIARQQLEALFDTIMMFWTGAHSDANPLLQAAAGHEFLLRMRDHAHRLGSMTANGAIDPAEFGAVLDESWATMRIMLGPASTSRVDALYALAKAAGARGGTLCGGGGFLLLIVEPEHRSDVRRVLPGLMEMTIRPEVHGSRVIAGA